MIYNHLPVGALGLAFAVDIVAPAWLNSGRRPKEIAYE